MKCSKGAIRAHSVQNSRFLDQLVRNGHVVNLTHSATLGKGLNVDFALIGRNKATTFTGLCSHHDNLIFTTIEKSELNFAVSEHLFMLAYRSAYRELHATMETAAKLQAAYLERVERDLDSSNEPSPNSLFAVQRMMDYYDTFNYKSLLDTAHFDRDFQFLDHKVITFDTVRATVAVCALFSVDNIQVREDVLRIHLNVLPVSQTQTVVLFSYLKSDATPACAFLGRVLGSGGLHQRYELSRLILDSCENFVLSPNYFDTWCDDKKNTIRDYFVRTIMKSDLGYESPHLYLF